MQEMIELSNVSKSRFRRNLVKNLNFSIHSGEIMGLIGPNGAGKSTTINLILSLLRPSSGKVLKSSSFSIGGMPEASTLYGQLSGLENLKQFARMKRKNVSFKQLKNLIEFFELENEMNVPAQRYSFGLTRQFLFLIAIMDEPDFVILDEPFNGIDPEKILLMKEKIQTLAKEGTGVLLSSHLLSGIENSLDSITILNQGKQLYSGEIRSLKETGLILLFQTNDNQQVTKWLKTQNISFAEIDGVLHIVIKQNQLDFQNKLINWAVKTGLKINLINRPDVSLSDRYIEIIREAKQ